MIYYQQQQPYKDGNDKLMIVVVYASKQRQEIICYVAQHFHNENGKLKTIATLRKQMKQLNTKFNLENTMCCAIAEWFKIGHVHL